MLAEIDTRALVRHLRDHGVMRGVISTLERDTEKLVAKARSIPKMDGTDLAKVVSTNHTYVWEAGERSHRADEVVGVKDEPAAIPRRGLRLRHQAEHSAQAARRGLQGDSCSGADAAQRMCWR